MMLLNQRNQLPVNPETWNDQARVKPTVSEDPPETANPKTKSQRLLTTVDRPRQNWQNGCQTHVKRAYTHDRTKNWRVNGPKTNQFNLWCSGSVKIPNDNEQPTQNAK